VFKLASIRFSWVTSRGVVVSLKEVLMKEHIKAVVLRATRVPQSLKGRAGVCVVRLQVLEKEEAQCQVLSPTSVREKGRPATLLKASSDTAA